MGKLIVKPTGFSSYEVGKLNILALNKSNSSSDLVKKRHVIPVAGYEEKT